MKRDFDNQDRARSPEEHFAEQEQNGHMRNGISGDSTADQAYPRAADSQLMRLRPADTRQSENSPRYRYTEDEGGEGLDLRQVLTLLRRRRKILLTTFFTVVAAGCLFTWLSRPIYQATSQILVNTSSSGSGSGANVLTDLLGDARARSLETQMAVLQSGPVFQGALARLSPEHQKAVQEFFDLKVSSLTTTDVLVVSVSSYNPQTAAALGNAIGSQYIQQSKEQNQERVRVATRFVSEQRKTVGENLDKARRALREFKTQHNIVQLGPESTARVGELSQNQAELRAAQTELSSNRAQLTQLRALAATIPSSHVIPTIRRRPTVEALQQQITRLEIELAAVRQEYAPGSDEVQRIQGQLTALRRRLSNEAVTEVVGSTRVIDPNRQAIMGKISDAQAQIWAQEARIPALSKGVAAIQSQLKTLPQREYELSKINSELATLEKTFETLNEQFVTLRINAEGQLASASIMSPAAVPTTPISPRVGRNILMSIALGLMLAIALATLTDRLDDRVHSEEDAENASRLPVLAHIPFMADKEKQSLIGQSSGNSALLESYRMLRTNIEFSSVDEPVRTLVVTSSQPGEGKSTTSADLAIVMALDGKKVIIVDCDLRRPSLHRLFALPNRVGFTSVVAGQSSLEDALQETKIPGLFVLTSGPVPPNPPEVLNSKAGRAVFTQVAQQADFAVLDTPPALVMADAQIVASIADAAMLVISFKEAGKREIARTSELISQTGTKVLGSVLNKLTDEVDGYYGYYGYKNRYYGRYLDNDGNQTESLTEGLKRADNNSANGTAIAVADQQPGQTSEHTPPGGSV